MPPPPTDRNLLFGILALQLDFIGRDDLIAAMHAWVLDKARPLGQVLVEQGVLPAGRRALLDGLVEEHLKQHGDDPQHSLAAASAARPLPEDLKHIADADLQASLASLSSDHATPETRVESHPPADAVRYRKLRPHARGGLGEVFVAEDTELHREVALKEIQPRRADDPSSRGRFILEAEITGRLEHPGVVPVYGFGIYPDGRPYYAMRFLRGGSLKEAIDRFHAAEGPVRDAGERRLAFHQLLRRFIDVCNAMAYAHSRGVLHRDLKPGNVMLGRYGETLVVDWGLAKAGVRRRGDGSDPAELTVEPTLQPASSSDAHATQAGAALGTPMYMSPEQAEGRLHELGPASDIYSLGATLYTLLTGRKPFEGADAAEVLARVQRGELVPPRQAKPGTPPALDAVCRKAMALRPADRYPTALDLAADVEHWLADEPVAAYPEPWTVRAGRWARRHRTAVVGAAVFLLSAVVALAASTALVWREQRKTEQQKLLAEEQKRVAEENYDLARDLSFNSIDLIESSQLDWAAGPAAHASAQELLKTAAQVFRQYLEQQPGNPALRGRVAQVDRYTADVLLATNDLEGSKPFYLESLDLLEGLAREDPKALAYRGSLSDTLRDYSHWQSQAGQLREATGTLDRAIDIAEKTSAEHPDRPAPRRALAVALLDLAVVEYDRGQVAESGKTAERAVNLFHGLLDLPAGQHHPYDSLLLAAALNRVAGAERDAGRLDAAWSAHKEAVNRLQAMVTTRPNADILSFAALCRLEQSRTGARMPEHRASAETNLGQAILQWERLAGDYPRIPLYRELQGVACQARGQLRADGSRLDEARADFEKSRQLFEGLVKEDPQVPAYRGHLGRAYAGLGRLARAAGDKAGAAGWFARAADALRQAVEQSPDNAQDRRSLEEVRTELAR